MKGLGLTLVGLGFLGGALVAVQTADNRVAWSWFVPAAMLAVAGVALARAASHRETRHAGTLSANVDMLNRSLEAVLAHIGRLDAEKAAIDVYELHDRIDALFPEDLSNFADARKSVEHVYGIQAYAEVMSTFAAGERYLNRVWSASVDGYIDEAHDYLGRARRQFETTREKLLSLQTPGAPGD